MGSGNEEGVYAEAISLQLRNIELPEAYKTAVDNKQEAEEDIKLAQAQRKQETTKAGTEEKTAIKEAEKISQTAENEAEIIRLEASRKADETTYSFEQEAEALLSFKQELNLTTEGLLAYV